MKAKGIVLTILSAVIYGFTPVIGRMTYTMGSNGITLAFFRYLFVLPFLFILALMKKENMKLSGKQLRAIVEVSLGCSFTVALLYSSYCYTAVGTATTIHFMYPLWVSLAISMIFREKPEKPQLICLILCTVGILGFWERGQSAGMTGIGMAFLSSLTFSFYMIRYSRTAPLKIPPFTFALVMSALVALEVGAFGMASGSLVLNLPARAHIYNLIVAVFASIFGTMFLQAGISYLGASLAAVFSMFEPLTSVIIGYLVLHENLTITKAVGCFLILGGVIYLIAQDAKKSLIRESPSKHEQ